MSSLAMPSSVTAALPAVNIHPHGHGHRKGPETGSLSNSSSSSTAAQIPVGSTQNLFGSLLTSLEQVIGAQPAQSQPAQAAASPAQSAQAAQPGIGSKVNVLA